MSGQRRVVGLPGVRLGAHDIECFDRHFFEHPLVRFHFLDGGRVTRRISDSLSRSEFKRSAIYVDDYRRAGLEHTVAVPLLIDARARRQAMGCRGTAGRRPRRRPAALNR